LVLIVSLKTTLADVVRHRRLYFPSNQFVCYYEYYKNIFHWHEGVRVPLEDCYYDEGADLVNCKINQNYHYTEAKSIMIYLGESDIPNYLSLLTRDEIDNLEIDEIQLFTVNKDKTWSPSNLIFDLKSNSVGKNQSKKFAIKFNNNRLLFAGYNDDDIMLRYS